MYEERESDVPDWETKEVEIPESLKKKWREEEAEGIRAGVCTACGWPYTKMDLSCRHCGKPTEISGGVLVGLRRWFFKTRIGLLALIFILLGIFLFICVMV
ncbi:MAG: hypothetical protein COT00_01565 [Candidatus Omnitrophica bacterium CG07_land_8_20_14_0_80_50_8]|nr:MAG: hypothetical protein AUJ71_00610 [Candidatus Omnitrophica bacterium CG1_02_49_16]PIU40466.1 MAG: hypothetical protein COT00_01565 [Candidatus Omnitrophica bacterium CG07_land_8_20_14_0_80_50_8]